MNITDQELKNLETAKNETEWNKICDEIKQSRNGSYPPDWYSKVILGNINSNINLEISI